MIHTYLHLKKDFSGSHGWVEWESLAWVEEKRGRERNKAKEEEEEGERELTAFYADDELKLQKEKEKLWCPQIPCEFEKDKSTFFGWQLLKLLFNFLRSLLYTLIFFFYFFFLFI